MFRASVLRPATFFAVLALALLLWLGSLPAHDAVPTMRSFNPQTWSREGVSGGCCYTP